MSDLRPSREADERARIGAVLSGDPEAFDRWYRAEHAAVWRLALGFLADAAEAEDAAQDAMLKLYDELESYDARRSWRAWRNAVVLNLCRDRLRRAGARRRAERDAAAEREEAAPLPDPPHAAAREEVRDALEQALARLSPREREAFVLRELEGHATDEVAALLDVGESTVRSLLTLARRRMRRYLAPRLALEPEGGEDA